MLSEGYLAKLQGRLAATIAPEEAAGLVDALRHAKALARRVEVDQPESATLFDTCPSCGAGSMEADQHASGCGWLDRRRLLRKARRLGLLPKKKAQA